MPQQPQIPENLPRRPLLDITVTLPRSETKAASFITEPDKHTPAILDVLDENVLPASCPSNAFEEPRLLHLVPSNKQGVALISTYKQERYLGVAAMRILGRLAQANIVSDAPIS